MVLTTDNNNYTNDSKYEEYFKLFNYELSPFQKHAIQGIVDGNHVLVTAATGSGKTLPAEFAIRHFTGLGKRVIYCSPIKALSNQKTFDFTQKYPDITFGLLTGDIKTNPTAQVLIMTTEILMNQLFTQSANRTESSLSFSMDIENELGCVVFDEFHYINDEHRGHVWEQSILMLPQHVQMVMLSATLDDPVKSARWIEERSNTVVSKQVVICSTDKRVVPLTHYLYLNGTEGFYKKMKDKDTEARFRKSVDKCLPIRSADGVFNETTYKEAKNVLDALSGNDVFLKRKNVLNNLFAHLRDQDMLPAICFVFSRKAVEQCAEEITVPLGELRSPRAPPCLRPDSCMTPPFNDECSNSSLKGGFVREPSVSLQCESILKRLPNWREYHGLPEYQNLVRLLEKGIGIHHSGMVPVLREIVEFMISKKYIKVLFATESFAIGLDCPIKTAVFINLKKYDGGDSPRYLLPHEYTQMAGRAGRRGIDTVGHVVHCSNLFELPSMTTYKEVLCGLPQKLESKFQIYYSVILNLFKNAEKVSVKDIENFIMKSMLQTEMNSVVAGLLREVEETEKKILQKEQGLDNLKTAKETLKTYSELLSKMEFSANKKRKEIDISIRKISAENLNLEKDYVFYIDYLRLKKALDDTRSRLRANQRYIVDKVERLLRVLVEVNVIQKVSEDEYVLIAGVVSEINPILITHLLHKWNNFDEFGSNDLVAFLSLFTDVRVNEECRIYPGFSNYCDNPFMNDKIKSFEYARTELWNTEVSHGICVKDSGLEGFCYEMVDFMYDWCECKDEMDCKAVIAQIEMFGVSIGDFNKAILKISTLARELMGITDDKVDLMHKLSKIDGLILKYVATNQSLYL